MAKEVSFQGLVVLALLLIIVSVFSTVFVLNQIRPGAITGLVSGIARVNVTAMIIISLPVNAVDFGAIGPGASDDTEDNFPGPFVIQNDGTVFVDVTIARDNASTPLFNGTGGGDNTTSFQFKAGDNETGSINEAQSITDWTNVPGTAPLTFIRTLKYQDNHDAARVDILIDVPSDEPPGLKSETVNFIAVQS